MNKLLIFIVLILIISSSCVHKKKNVSNKKEATQYEFDGFKLADNYGEIMKRSPYNSPCDNDPIDNKSRRFMCYGALPCRDLTFPQKTTVIFYLKYSAENKYNQPIEAFAFLYGSYFNDKTNFPLNASISFSISL